MNTWRDFEPGTIKAFFVVAFAWTLVLALAPATDAVSHPGVTRARVCKPNPDPTPQTELPPSLKSVNAKLIGTGVLWSVAPDHPSYVAGRRIWATEKQPWFRLIEGELTIEGRRTDEGSGRFHAELPPMDAYPLDLNMHIGPGFIPSSLEFSAGGCWKVVARLGPSKVVLSVHIDDSKAAVCAALSADLRAIQRSDHPDNEQAAIIAKDQRTRRCPA